MAQVFELQSDAANDPVVKSLTKSLQSGHINVLLGAGASCPAIPTTGNVEAELDALLQAGNSAEARSKVYSLLRTIQAPLNDLLDGIPNSECSDTTACYRTFLSRLESILAERRTTVLSRQATVFTTNYDVLIDMAANACDIATVGNGFSRAIVADESSEFSSRHFFRSTFDTGNLFDYRVELPTLSLVKLHGCVSWLRDGDRILMRRARRPLPLDDAAETEINNFIDSYTVILPQSGKFNTTVLNRTYYELLRLYANSLDKENALLLVFGFSFRDEHILHITRRALTNPTLRLVVFAYDAAGRQALESTFAGHRNVTIVAERDPDKLDFRRFNKLLADAASKG